MDYEIKDINFDDFVIKSKKMQYEILEVNSNFNYLLIGVSEKKKFFKFHYTYNTRKFRLYTNDNDKINDFLQNYSAFVNRTFNENPLDDEHLELLHCAVGLAEETGEVLGHIKKYVFHSKPLDITKVKSELGDVTWYMFALMNKLKLKLQEIIVGNEIKLTTRYPNGRNKNYKLNERNEDIENQNIELK